MTATKLTATIRRAFPGNFALESDTFTIPLELALEAIKHLDTRPGCYWESARKAVNRAKRAKQDTVTLYTAGFGSQALTTAIWAAGGTAVSAA